MGSRAPEWKEPSGGFSPLTAVGDHDHVADADADDDDDDGEDADADDNDDDGEDAMIRGHCRLSKL